MTGGKASYILPYLSHELTHPQEHQNQNTRESQYEICISCFVQILQHFGDRIQETRG